MDEQDSVAPNAGTVATAGDIDADVDDGLVADDKGANGGLSVKSAGEKQGRDDSAAVGDAAGRGDVSVHGGDKGPRTDSGGDGAESGRDGGDSGERVGDNNFNAHLDGECGEWRRHP